MAKISLELSVEVLLVVRAIGESVQTGSVLAVAVKNVNNHSIPALFQISKTTQIDKMVLKHSLKVVLCHLTINC